MSSGDMSGLESRLVRLHGRVQGVGYRETCVHHARALGVTGWVRNRSDGSVEVLLQGSPNQLAHMCDWLRTGVPGAKVDAIEVKDVPRPFDTLDTFERHPTV
jgi:acylphosphatase